MEKDYSELDIIQVEEEVNAELSDAVEYPCLFIEGITTKQEILYFMHRGGNSEISLPLYYEFQGLTKCIGRFELSLNSILGFLSIYHYDLYISTAPGERKKIDLDNPDNLVQFIRL